MNGRVYDVSTRRFLTPDSVLDQPFTTFGTQPYSYVAHNPTNFVDPTGFGATYVGGVTDQWNARAIAEKRNHQSIPCEPGGAECDQLKRQMKEAAERLKQAREAPGRAARAAAAAAARKGFYDSQWGGEESAPPPDEPSQSAGRSWVTSSSSGIQQLSFAQSGLVSPAGLGNLGGARSYGTNPSSAANHLATLPKGFNCDEVCVATGGGLAPGSFMVQGGAKAAGVGLTFVQRLLRWAGFSPAARAAGEAAQAAWKFGAFKSVAKWEAQLASRVGRPSESRKPYRRARGSLPKIS